MPDGPLPKGGGGSKPGNVGSTREEIVAVTLSWVTRMPPIIRHWSVSLSEPSANKASLSLAVTVGLMPSLIDTMKSGFAGLGRNCALCSPPRPMSREK